MNVHNYNETDVLHNYLLKASNKSSENKHLILNHSIKTLRLSNLVVTTHFVDNTWFMLRIHLEIQHHLTSTCC